MKTIEIKDIFSIKDQIKHIKKYLIIDDNEDHNLIKMADEILGEKNFVSNIVWNVSIYIFIILLICGLF
jgi:adenine specific DNA methylase Mod